MSSPNGLLQGSLFLEPNYSEPGAMPQLTWLSPYLSAYLRAYRFEPTQSTARRMARALRELEKVTPAPEVLRRFENYLKATKVPYYSAERFAATFPFWSDEQPTKVLPGGVPNIEPNESVEAYTQRLIRLGF